ncbi:hypothetical protein JCM10207_002770 [Rhodosporidiobolus poonsookiae]
MSIKTSPSLSGHPPSAHRPRLSPKSPNGMRGDYFVPPTPAADHGPPGWSPFGPSDGTSRGDENAGWAAFASGYGKTPAAAGNDVGSVGGGAAGTAVGSSAAGAGTASGVVSASEGGTGWGGAAPPPSFALSPSSSAFNAKFNHLLRGPTTGTGSTTPLHAPTSSPFFPGAPASSAPSTSASPFPPPHPAFANPSSNQSSSAVPPTPGPSTTAGLSFPPPDGFKLPTALPFGGRKLAGRPGGRPSTSPASAVASARYTLYNPQTLFSTILPALPPATESPPDPPPMIILDIRTHTAYLSERLATSINVCVPSTLLRRPAFGIDRVGEGLPPADQAIFSKWSSAGAIVVLDAESTSLAEGGGVASLLAKFDKAGFKGKLGWVKGGWYAIRTQARALPAEDAARLIEMGMANLDASASAPVSRHATPLEGPVEEGSASAALPENAPGGGASTPSKKHPRPVLQVRDLPIAAFQLASTSAFVNSGPGAAGGKNAPLPTNSRGLDFTVTSPSTSGGSAASLASQRPGMGKRRKSGNEGMSDMPQLGMGGFAGYASGMATPGGSGRPGPSERAAMRGGDSARQRMATNPFFDNIRQNSEALSLERSLSNLIAVELPAVPPSILPSLPPYLRSLIALSPMSRADRLARQFYELESAERERLEGTFRWHSGKSADDAKKAQAGGRELEKSTEVTEQEREAAEKWSRFGIFAGVELGNLNRFKNIFPYEHARVHLENHSPNATDYVNASHLFLRNSSKRFIASQGPLPTTFRDFWQMCDQEHVGVIIMLTNLNEGGREKCGRYWIQQKDGEWDVQVEGDLAHEEEERISKGAAGAGGMMSGGGPGAGGGFFASFDAARISPEEEKKAPAGPQDTTIRRTITVQRRQPRSASSARPRKIRHIQYRAWPDFDIPAEPADVVALVHEVEAAQRDYMREIGWNPDEHDGLEPPILAHCSAGVGRTGVFIMVSSLLERLRRDREEARRSSSAGKEDRMEIDPTPPTRPPLPERLSSDPETSSLSVGLSLSSLDSTSPSPSPSTASFPSGATTAVPTAIPSPSELAPFDQKEQHLPSMDVPALEQADPVFAGVNELREQRMSMVANYRQYVCVLECVIEGAVAEMQAEAREAGQA